jgi:hypothetical protein
MRYERDNSLGTAAAIVRDRVRASESFAEARRWVKERVMARVMATDRSVDAMRQMGGWSAIIRTAITLLPDQYRANVGSEMFPATVAEELCLGIGRLRTELQTELQLLPGDRARLMMARAEEASEREIRRQLTDGRSVFGRRDGEPLVVKPR